MRKLTAILSLCLALVAGGCGSDDAETTAAKPEPGFIVLPGAPEKRFAKISGGEGGEQPKLDPSASPVPKKPIARDLEVGDGRVAHWGDTVAIYYFGANYETGKRQYYRWPPQEELVFKLGEDGHGDPWDEGIEGMKVGGRRELVIPAGPRALPDPIDYLVELVRVEPTG
ncbi:MAG TPA: FKBP-type peptidyl-prolyl cis-trans isomerase [Solirubrobacterales bacterium]|nr:FKBP-type peptidyl-prolyl cis-trans isomerase [Solirubrobacterales bacterium]